MSSTTLTPTTETWLTGTGGQIFIRHWQPSDTARANLVICHGVNSHGGQYVRAAGEFAQAGYAVTVLDLRGRGRSEGERFYVESIDDYVSDVSLAIDYAKAQQPDLPTYLLGHSAGGVTAVTYALDYQDRIDGLVCESFAFRVFAPDFALKLIEGASHIIPHVHVLKLKMDDFSRDPEWVAQLKADPLTQGESQPVQTFAAFARAGERFERDFPKLKLPVLILHGTGDKATRPDGSQQFFNEAGSEDKTLKLYDEHAHDLLNDFGREQVMADINGWIDTHIEQRMPLVT
jgi:alpha-beta hydrolase superfamily lysophospholipase